MNNFEPEHAPARRADMDGGWSFDELCIVGGAFAAAIVLALKVFISAMGAW